MKWGNKHSVPSVEQEFWATQHGIEVRNWINPSEQWHSPHKPAYHPLSVKPDKTWWNFCHWGKALLESPCSTPWWLSPAGKGPWEGAVLELQVNPHFSTLFKTSNKGELPGNHLSTLSLALGAPGLEMCVTTLRFRFWGFDLKSSHLHTSALPTEPSFQPKAMLFSRVFRCESGAGGHESSFALEVL